MSIGIMAGLFIGSLIIVLLTGLPVAFVLIGLSILFCIIFVGPAGAYSSVYIFFGTVTKDIYIACPLFCFMAFVLQFSGIATALYDMMYKWFGGIRGGLAMGTVAICTLIAAMTGIGATGVVTLGVIALPEMLRRNYNKDMAVGCIPFGGGFGSPYPPQCSNDYHRWLRLPLRRETVYGRDFPRAYYGNLGHRIYRGEMLPSSGDGSCPST